MCAVPLLLPACRDAPGGGAADGSTGADESADTSADAGTASTGEDTDSDDDDPMADVEYLSPTDHLIRASLALRGLRPSLAELEAVEEDPDALPGIVDDYLQSDDFGATIRDLHNEAWLLRAFTRPDLHGYQIQYTECDGCDPIELLPGLAPDVGEIAVSQDAQEMPLRLIEHVVMNDRPYSEIVTADYTLANGITSRLYGLPYDGDGDSWEVTSWDNRPAAGVLSETMVFYRHKSMPSNGHRGRANAVTRALLCIDFVDLDISFDGAVDLTDEDAVADAIKTNPSCQGCHASLDPVASFLYGWEPFRLNSFTSYPHDAYIPQLEDTWQGGGVVLPTDVPPALFGKEGDDLADLGRLIANDGDFSRCAASRFYAYLTQTPLGDVPDDAVDELDAAFVDSGLDAKTLAREIVLSDWFRVSHALDGADGAEEVIGYQRLRPRQLDRAVRDLTGFDWTVMAGEPLGNFRMLEESFIGYEAIAGGIDSYYATTPTYSLNPTSSLVIRQLAAAAAAHVVEDDFGKPRGDRRLLTVVEPNTTNKDALREQIQRLHLLLLGERVGADSDAVEETLDLFLEIGGRSPLRYAWTITIAAMLQDVRFTHY